MKIEISIVRPIIVFIFIVGFVLGYFIHSRKVKYQNYKRCQYEDKIIRETEKEIAKEKEYIE